MSSFAPIPLLQLSVGTELIRERKVNSQIPIQTALNLPGFLLFKYVTYFFLENAKY